MFTGVGNRLYPYPVLNAVPVNSSYKPEITFKLDYEIEYTQEYLILRDLHCETSSNFIKSLIDESKAEILLIFECPQTLFRKKYNITFEAIDLEIPLSELNGSCSFSAYVVAKENIETSSEVDEFADEYCDFPGLKITFEKHDVIAIDELHKTRVGFENEDDIKKASIIKVEASDDCEEGQTSVRYTDNLIFVTVSRTAFESYNATKDKGFREVYLAMLAIPALKSCINDVLTNDDFAPDDMIGDSIANYKWFYSFSLAYEKIYGKEFSGDDLKNLDEIVQKVFDYPIGKSMILIANFLGNGGELDED